MSNSDSPSKVKITGSNILPGLYTEEYTESIPNRMYVNVSEHRGAKHDSGKPDMSLLSPQVLEHMAQVLTFGAQKYGRANFLKGIEYSRLMAAAQRHISKFQQGVTLDEESNLPHLAHAMVNLMMLLHFETLTRSDLDDRVYKK